MNTRSNRALLAADVTVKALSQTGSTAGVAREVRSGAVYIGDTSQSVSLKSVLPRAHDGVVRRTIVQVAQRNRVSGQRMYLRPRVSSVHENKAEQDSHL